jgi:hypothetical protein
VLTCSAFPGPESGFQPVFEQPAFGDADLKSIRIVASTSGPLSSLDVRVTDLRIRAEWLPNTPTGTDTGATTAQPSEGKSRMLAVEIVGGLLLLSLVCVLGVFLLLRQRRGPVEEPTQIKPAPLSFPCPRCGKALRAKAELAGRKVKCWQCAAAVQVPAVQADESGPVPA